MNVEGLWLQIQQKRSLIPAGYHLRQHEEEEEVRA